MLGAIGKRCRVRLCVALVGVLLFAGNLVSPSVSADGAVAAGRAVPACLGRTATIVGTAGADTLTGTAGSDVIVGRGGNDTISGGGGGDFLCGGLGDDTISGGGGPDSMSGDAGADLLVGGTGGDRVLGAGGNDTLKGQGGHDLLDGGPGADSTLGGPGTDTCAKAETRASCEIIPPTGCTNPPLVAATPLVTTPTIVGSNAYEGWSSIGIGGEHRSLTFVAQIRNDSAESIRPRNAVILVYDAVGTKIAKRFAYGEADILAPGESTVLTETMPSILYMEGEDNFFPEGWASWEILFGPITDPGTVWDKVIIGSRLSSLTRDTDGKVTAQGAAVNTLDRNITSFNWWLILYDTAGRLLNVETRSGYASGGLAPGSEAPFQLEAYSYTCFGSVAWGAAGR